MSAIIYTRVSTDEQASKGYSLRDQEARLREYCTRTGRDVAAHYQDDASAKSFDRPGFDELLTYVRQHPGVDELLIQKWDRFSRDHRLALNMIDELDRLGVRVQAIEQPIDLDIPEQRMMLAVYLAAPEVENRRRSLNTKVGMRRALHEGRWCSMAPYGYSNTRDERGQPIIEPNDMAALVHEAFELAATTDLAVSEILVRLRKKGFKRSRSQMYALLKNPIYKGYIRIPAWRDEPEELVRGLHESIVAPDVFDRVQEVRFDAPQQKQPKSRGGVREELPLRGHMVCPTCSTKEEPSVITGSISRGNGGKYAYYHCQGCDDYRVRADEVHEAMPPFLQGLQLDPAVADLYRSMVTDMERGDLADGKREAKRIKTRIAEIDTKLLRNDEFFVEGTIEKDSYTRLKADLIARRAEAEAELAKAERIVLTSAADVRQAADLMEGLPAIWLAARQGDPTAAYDLIGSIVPEGIAFEAGSIRTPFGASIIGLFGPKTQNADSHLGSASGVVPPVGLEPTTR